MSQLAISGSCHVGICVRSVVWSVSMLLKQLLKPAQQQLRLNDNDISNYLTTIKTQEIL